MGDLGKRSGSLSLKSLAMKQLLLLLLFFQLLLPLLMLRVWSCERVFSAGGEILTRGRQIVDFVKEIQSRSSAIIGSGSGSVGYCSVTGCRSVTRCHRMTTGGGISGLRVEASRRKKRDWIFHRR